MADPAKPLIEVRNLQKQIHGPSPLRIRRLRLDTADHIALFGLDAAHAEALVHLLTGALLPDTGDVLIAGHNTRAIATDTEWLRSLDRFGLVTRRAVFLESLPLIANLAVPLTLAIEPIPTEVRERVTTLARAVDLADQIEKPMIQLTPVERMRAHLARALVIDPSALLLEHPTNQFEAKDAIGFGRILQRVSESRQLPWIALTDDERFAEAAEARRVTLNVTSGDLAGADVGFWSRFSRRRT